ncbi:MAG: hypothetical protein H0T71_17140, partial [Acidobacteria bacterium]|nr:hypothetical protein [Acidobacteriota bacterium]
MTRPAAVLAAALVAAATSGPAGTSGTSGIVIPDVPSRVAFFVRSLLNPAERREARPDILDAPVLPGSIIKAVTLVAAIESQVIEAGTARMCRRTVT